MKRKHSLKNKIVFTDTLKNPDKKISNSNFIIAWKRNDALNNIKIGIAISKKVKLSVDRNKYKRVVRLYATKYMDLSKKANIVLVFKFSATGKDKGTLEVDFSSLVSKTPFKLKEAKNKICKI